MIAKPIPRVSSMMAVLMPMTSARRLTSGPPLLPGFIGAVCRIMSMRVSCGLAPIETPVALTIPSVTIGPPGIARACPIASTGCPTTSFEESPSLAGWSSISPGEILMTAVSVCTSPARNTANKLSPVGRVTMIVWEFSTRWLFVKMCPTLSKIIPVPTASIF